MRLFHRAGIVLALAVAACGKDSPSPVDFNDPAAVSSNLSAVDSAFDSDVFRSFTFATLSIEVAAPQPGIQQATTLLETLRAKLQRTGAHIFLPNLLRARKLQALMPNLSISAAEGRIIPDTMYGRVFEWNETSHQYEYMGTDVTNLNGVRFVLYALGLDGDVFEPVTAIGTLDIIDQSTPSLLQLHVLVKNSAGTTTYVDYTASFQAGDNSASATVSGEITNGLSGGNNKTLSFDQTLTANAGGVRITATFALNNPAITLMLNESLTFDDTNLIISADFRVIQNGETVRTVARITSNQLSGDFTVNITVYVDGHPVASLNGDPSDPATQWVDAGGEPLTLEDLAALDDLFAAFESFDAAVFGLFVPIGVLTGQQ
ncbi:MAG TPA: hypothetical protein VK573_05565 [Gemmatimonadales bacterium]|nr:hypothetical protein [Gemmatimonadales bacterium]